MRCYRIDKNHTLLVKNEIRWDFYDESSTLTCYRIGDRVEPVITSGILPESAASELYHIDLKRGYILAINGEKSTLFRWGKDQFYRIA